MIIKLPNRFLRSAALAAGLCAVFTGPAVAQNLVLKAGHAASTSNTGHKAFEFLGQELAEKTDGRIVVEIFPSSQLGSERELVESIQLGNVDMTFVSSAVLGSFNPQFFALDIPFMFKDRDGVYRVLDGEIGQDLLSSLEQVGIKGLGYWENGFRQLTNNKQEIRSPEDLEGMRMRTMENAVHIEAWREVGANPAPLAFGELFTALQQGTFDAQEGPINLFYDMRFHEVQDYISLTNHVYSPWPVLINPDVYSSLSDEDKVILEEAITNTTEYQRDLARKADEAAISAMPDITITELTPEEIEAFASYMGPVYEMVEERVGKEIIDAILAEVN
ncbi:TRAP transporter substrate-binding protein [Vreelandella titanicae]|uniref:TRAP transporter substrate-binding protein n=1 Tax=Vreelandella titanicae TaxID=664683 RepID=UPI00137284E0|nr:TRAP transporter substrate-binding protein [Halomonas titanicae]NAO98909.1 DctP family TRAP transporter solute-binding subunit [Halomonas sp. MG34]NVE93058.1 DctP family TRAP transporter solute-binding subunit [Halomonas titanicae]